jgi:large subunit ribosomal protein L21
LVQSLAVPKPDSSLSAVVVSGGKQYRVAPGDRILVDRLTGEPGSSLKLGRVLLFNDGKEIKVGPRGSTASTSRRRSWRTSGGHGSRSFGTSRRSGFVFTGGHAPT